MRHIITTIAIITIAALAGCIEAEVDYESQELRKGEAEQREWHEGAELWRADVRQPFAIILADDSNNAGVYGYDVATGALSFAYVANGRTADEQSANLAEMENAVATTVADFGLGNEGAGFIKKPKGPGPGPIGEPGFVPPGILVANGDAIGLIQELSDIYSTERR